MHARRAPALSALALTLAPVTFASGGCSLLTDTDGLTGNDAAIADVAPGDEIGVDAADDAPGTDDGGDGGGPATDGSSPVDAAPYDGNLPPTYGASTFCADGGYTFCEDFDELPLPGHFDAVEGAYLHPTATAPASAPNDVLLDVPSSAPNGFVSKLTKAFDTAAGSVVVGFDVDPLVLNTNPATGLLLVATDFLQNASAKYSLRVAAIAGSVRIEESYLSGADRLHTLVALPTGAYVRVTLRATLSGRSPQATLTVGAGMPATETLSPPAGVDLRPTLIVGAVYGSAPQTGWTLRFDDVTFDLYR